MARRRVHARQLAEVGRALEELTAERDNMRAERDTALRLMREQRDNACRAELVVAQFVEHARTVEQVGIWYVGHSRMWHAEDIRTGRHVSGVTLTHALASLRRECALESL